MSQPLLEFDPREVFLGAAWSADGRVALCGLEQGVFDPTSSLYAVGDLKTGEIIWQDKRKPFDISFEMVLSPDQKQVFARVLTLQDKLVFDMSNGAATPLPKTDYPFFSPDGESFVRLLELSKQDQKPHLKIAQIYER